MIICISENIKGKEFRECTKCNSLLQFEETDIVWESGRNENGMIDLKFCDNGYILCPVCKNQQWIKRN